MGKMWYPSSQQLSEFIVDDRTGLPSTYNEHFRVPLLFQRSTGALRMRAGTDTVNKVPVQKGVTLDWYARLRYSKSGRLFVHFNGADKLDSTTVYPRFARVQSLRASENVDSFISFADPTVVMGRRKLLLGWYLGGESYDPLYDLLRVIRKASQMAGAPRVCLIGGSGGGLAALRVGAYIPGSLVYVQDPQTNIEAYIPSVRDLYFESLWPGWDSRKLMCAFPERFDMIRLYKSLSPDNYVYYYQNVDDPRHVHDHYGPFRKIFSFHGDTDTDVLGRRRFRLVKGEYPGHGKIVAREFDQHLTEAVSWWRDGLDD